MNEEVAGGRLTPILVVLACYDEEAVWRARHAFATCTAALQGFHCTADILLKLSRHRVRLVELPFFIRYDVQERQPKPKVA